MPTTYVQGILTKTVCMSCKCHKDHSALFSVPRCDPSLEWTHTCNSSGNQFLVIKVLDRVSAGLAAAHSMRSSLIHSSILLLCTLGTLLAAARLLTNTQEPGKLKAIVNVHLQNIVGAGALRLPASIHEYT